MNHKCNTHECTASQQSPKILNLKECSLYLRRSESSLRNLILRRQVPFKKLGGRLVFLKDELEAWIQTSPGVSLEQLQRGAKK
jgi:predicted DNA-binding transcriptional regulator AlpA